MGSPPLPLLPQGYVLDPEDVELPAGYKIDPQTLGGYMQTHPGMPALSPGGFTPPSFGDLTGGAVRGIRDPIDAGAQMLAHGLTSVAPAGSGFEHWAQGQQQQVDEQNRAAEEDYQKNWRGGATGFDPGRMAGNVAATLPLATIGGGMLGPSLAGRMAHSALSGSVLSPLTTSVDMTQRDGDPAPNYWQEKGEQAKAGAIGGAAAVPIGSAIGRLVSPRATTNPQVQALMEHGSYPTVGELAGASGGPIGRGIGRVEEAVSNWPFIGDIISHGRRAATNQWALGAMNDALEPIGGRLAGGNVDRQAFNDLYGQIRDSYTRSVPAAGGFLDATARTDLGNLSQLASLMNPAQATQFSNMMDQFVNRNISQTGHMSGQAFKDAESNLGRYASDYLYGHGNNSDQRQLGLALREAQSTLRQWLERTNPAASADLQASNAAYSRMLPIEDAVVKTSLNPGQFTPSQLISGIKKYSGNLNMARGLGRGQNYAEAGQDILGNRVPDSGTTARGLMALGGGAVVGGLTGHGLSVDPATIAMALGGAGASAGIYSGIGRQIIANMMANRPAGAEYIGRMLQNPAFTGASSAAALSQRSPAMQFSWPQQ